MNLKNKKILITGATGGIGYYLVEKFNELGAVILATGTNKEKLENLKKNSREKLMRNNLNLTNIVKLKIL